MDILLALPQLRLIFIHQLIDDFVLSGAVNPLQLLEVSPCGRFIISTAGDGAVCVWDVAYQRLAGMETKEFRGAMVSCANINAYRTQRGTLVSHPTVGYI